MYRRCIFCAADLRQNEVIEHFPVGRRLAFDSAKGRLWVVCHQCQRWNLSPLEERWEALEECERFYRSTVRRVSTEHIGLACLSEGLELVRIGRPLRPEFAGWRYGDQFRRRRRRWVMGGIGMAGGIGALAIGSATLLAVGVAAPFYLIAASRLRRRWQNVDLKVRSNLGDVLQVSSFDWGHPRLRPGGGHEGSWQLELEHGPPRDAHGNPVTSPFSHAPAPATDEHALHFHRAGFRPRTAILTGAEAEHALAALLPRMNALGAGSARIRDAVADIEGVGDPRLYFAAVEARGCAHGLQGRPIGQYPAVQRLALEIVANEELERRALEGELTLLEHAWHDAEAVAAIADDLFVPAGVRGALRQLRRRAYTAGQRSPPTGDGNAGLPGGAHDT
jgi:hypothetical protein